MTMYDSAPPAPDAPRPFRRRTLVIGALSLLMGGVAAGAIVASTTGAGAATTATLAAASPTAAATSDTEGDHHGGGHDLSLSGTVTAVGTNSVTIKSGTATTTYGVDANSDIDKNGEAKLSDLAVGDAVTFSTTTSGSATVIDKLHTGDEAKNLPSPEATSTG